MRGALVVEPAEGIRLLLEAEDDALVRITFDAPVEAPAAGSAKVLTQAAHELEQYFAGKRDKFTFPYSAEGTPFQCAVWRQLTRIPYGDVISYAELAKRAGSPRAVRAVGAANGANPLAIVVPCHRVINSDGKLGGYGGGLDLKRRLLALEGVLLFG
jgi:methylated-DNA-[protein]-cysteine S-methyltransferase